MSVFRLDRVVGGFAKGSSFCWELHGFLRV